MTTPSPDARRWCRCGHSPHRHTRRDRRPCADTDCSCPEYSAVPMVTCANLRCRHTASFHKHRDVSDTSCQTLGCRCHGWVALDSAPDAGPETENTSMVATVTADATAFRIEMPADSAHQLLATVAASGDFEILLSRAGTRNRRRA